MEMLSKNRIDKFNKLMVEAKSNIAIILSHMDPDAIACAKLFAAICTYKLEKNVRIFYSGGLFHPQNRAIWNRFALADEFTPLEKLEDAEEYDVALLDSSDVNDPRLRGLEINPIVIVDHHQNKDLEETENSWHYVKSCGAAASLVAHLFLSLDLEFKQNDDLATLAVIALLTDADIKLLSKYVTALDLELYVHFMKYADAGKARETFDSVKDEKYLKLLKKAIDSRKDIGSFTFVHLDFMEDEDIDYASLLSDEFCAISGINSVVVTYMCSDFSFGAKLRTRDDKIDLVHEINKRVHAGGGEGGARHGKGAVRYPPPNVLPATSTAKEMYLNYMKQILTDAFTPTSE